MTDATPSDAGDPGRADAASPEKVEQVATEFDARGQPYARVTVVRREAPVSANVGDRALVTADGEIVGWIGGASCAQSIIEEEATAALETGEPTLVGLAPDPADVDRPGVEAYPMTCHSGGTIELFVEPVTPAPRLVVVGETPVARSLVQLAAELTYEVTAVTDPDGGDAGGGDTKASDATVAATDVESVADAIQEADYVVVASMGEYDEVGVAAGLRAGAAYVGLVASDERRDAAATTVANRLALDRDTVLDAVTTPAGIDIGAQTAEEIGVSILAELVALRRDAEGPIPFEATDATAAWEGAAGGGHDQTSGRVARAGSDEETTVDPVCGMDVTVGEAAATVEHRGETYHFCGQGCADAFGDDPERYLDTDVAASG
jgi:xanthine dehydrogenase accessory factor